MTVELNRDMMIGMLRKGQTGNQILDILNVITPDNQNDVTDNLEDNSDDVENVLNDIANENEQVMVEDYVEV